MKEIWKDIPGYESLYQANNYGEIKSFPRKYSIHKKPFIMKQRNNYKGYAVVTLCKNGIQKNKIVHRLIAQTFIPNPNNLPQVNHKDGNKQNNNVNNLEWCDNSYNQLHANRMGLNKNRIKRVREVCFKPVIQYDLDGNEIGRYSSLREASSKTGCNYKAMSLCALGKIKTSGGYKWKYVNSN